MTKELKGKLEAKLQEAGLDKGLLTFVSVKKEEEIQGVIDNLKKLSTLPEPPSTEEILKQKEIQAEIDRRITEAKKKWDEANPKPSDPPKPPNEGETMEEKIAKLLEQKLDEKLNPMSEKLGIFEKNKLREEKLSQVRNLLSVSKIPETVRESRLKYFNFEVDKDPSEWVKQQEQEHEAYHQSLIDSGHIAGAPDAGGKSTGELSPEEAEAYIDKLGI